MLLWWCDISLGLVVRVHTQFQGLAVCIHATGVGIGCKHMCNVYTGSWDQGPVVVLPGAALLVAGVVVISSSWSC